MRGFLNFFSFGSPIVAMLLEFHPGSLRGALVLERRSAVVTGSTSGIGLAIAKRFVSEGAYVFITSRRQSELDKAVAEIGKNVTAVQGDVSKLEDLDRLYSAVSSNGRRIDVVVANAGFVELGPITTATPE